MGPGRSVADAEAPYIVGLRPIRDVSSPAHRRGSPPGFPALAAPPGTDSTLGDTLATIQVDVMASRERERAASLALERERALGAALTTQMAPTQRLLGRGGGRATGRGGEAASRGEPAAAGSDRARAEPVGGHAGDGGRGLGEVGSREGVDGAARRAAVGGWRPAAVAGEMRERRGRRLGAGDRRRGEEGEARTSQGRGGRGSGGWGRRLQGRGGPWRLRRGEDAPGGCRTGNRKPKPRLMIPCWKLNPCP
jgi:hypothetical protein